MLKWGQLLGAHGESISLHIRRSHLCLPSGYVSSLGEVHSGLGRRNIPLMLQWWQPDICSQHLSPAG